MGAYLSLLVILGLTACFGIVFGRSYVLEHHEKRFGPAMVTAVTWFGLAVVMTLCALFYLSMKHSGQLQIPPY